MKKNAILIVLVSISMACTKESKKEPLLIPAAYVSTSYNDNIVLEADIRRQMSGLTAYMKKGEKIENKLLVDSLNYYFSNNGNPSLASITQPYYSSRITNSWFPVMAECSQNAFDVYGAATANNGGVFGARLLDKRAKETLQEIEKGLFQAALYNHFLSLSKNITDVSVVDKMLCIYGAHPNFPNTNTAANTPTPDAFIALYAARRDDGTSAGFYTLIKQQFLTLQAAVNGGDAYNEEREAAITELRTLIEKAIIATVIHYGYAGTTKLTTAEAPETTISGGLHDFAEAVGFMHGFKSIPTADRIISDAQIDEVLSLLLAPADLDASMYRFVTDGVNTLPNINEYQEILQDIYSFSEAEMESFKQNWISIQGR
jgi:hypothetical protein